MILMNESEMERSGDPTLSAHSSKTIRTKREKPAPPARERKHKSNKVVKIQDPHIEKDRLRKEERSDEGKSEDKKEASSTVINVDSVRQRTNRETEEMLGLLESEWHDDVLKSRSLNACELLLIITALATILFFFPISIWFCVKIVREHERAVVFRLGHLLQRKPRGPGLLFYLPFMDVCHIVDIRLKMLKVPSHPVVTKDLVCTEVNAVCYYRIENISVCYASLAEVPSVLQALVQLSVREILAHYTFTEILQHRGHVAQQIQVALDSIACRWGIRVERAVIEDLCLPPELQQNFAIEAEAKRQAQLKVIAAEGERAACDALKASIDSLSESPLAVQLRLLQLLHMLRSDQPAVLLNLPSDLLNQPLQAPDTRNLPNPTTKESPKESPKDSPMM